MVVLVVVSWLDRCHPLELRAVRSIGGGDQQESPTLTAAARPARRTLAPALAAYRAGGSVRRGAMAFHSARRRSGRRLEGGRLAPGSGTVCAWVPVPSAIEGRRPAGRIARPRRREQGRVHRERQCRAGGQARAQLIADQLGQLAHRDQLGRGAQVALVGDPLGVEGQDVADNRPGVQQGDGEVVVAAGLQPGQGGRGRTGRPACSP